MRTITEKKAIYGAIQRLLDKISLDYPYTQEDFYNNDDGFCPNEFQLVLGLSHEIMHFRDDYRNFKPDLGDYLLQKILGLEIV